MTGRGLVDGRPAVVVANDSTVKAGSWGARTVEKIVRATEMALREELPVFWLIDSAGARITDQVDLFPGRRGAGRIFHNQVALSGKVPQICCLFGPSAAGGAYIPAFTDVVIMVEGNASMYLGSPRMAEMVVGEKVSLEEMGGARMHCTVSGCGDLLAVDDADAIEQARLLFSYLPTCWREMPPSYPAEPPLRPLDDTVVPEVESQPFDVHEVIDGLVDDGSFFEIKPLFAAELVVGLARLDGEVVGVVANNSAVRGGVLFSDSADKAARFIWWCDAFNIPLLYLADVPGFMIGSSRRAGRHHPTRGQDDHGGVRGDGAAGLGSGAEGLRRRPLRDGRPGLRAGCVSRSADRPDRGHGSRGRRERRVCQQDRGDRGRG